MKHLKTIFACLLMAVLSIGQMWADDLYFEGFETNHRTSGNNSYAAGPQVYGDWSLAYADAVTSGSPLTGTAHVLMRVAKNTTNSPSLTSGALLSSNETITKVSWNCKGQTTQTLTVSYSSDGNTWTEGYSDALSTSKTANDFTLNDVAGPIYLKFVVTVSSSTTGNRDANIDDIKIEGTSSTGGETPTCADPTFSPAAGTFYGSQEITLATTTTGASIYYTLDGTTPSSSNGTLYEDPFTITETKTVKAIAVKDGATDSGVAEATYTAGATVSSYVIDFETNNLAAYVNWDFVNIKCATTTIAAHAGTYYGNTDGKASASITAKAKIATPGALTFWTSKESGNTTASSWIAQVSDDGDTWTDAGTFDATTGAKGEWTERTADLSAYTDVYVRIAYSGSTAIRAIDDISLSTTPSLLKPTISGVENFVNTTEVTISHATADAIYYTTNGDVPTTGSTLYSAPFELNATATVKAIAVKGGESSPVAEKEFTKIVPWTVAEANEQLGISTPQNGKYVRGIISQIDNYSSNAITYWISDDGSTTGQLEVYKGKNLNNTNFSAITDLALGDVVVVYGNLKVFTPSGGGSINEFDAGNYLVSKEAPAVAAPVFSPDGGGFMGETDVTITCETAGSAIYYTTNGETPSKSSTPYTAAIHLNATTTITAVAYVGDDASLVIAKTFTLTAPMTVAEALAALDSENPINNVAVAGIISTAPTANPSSGRLTYYISDDGSDTNELEVYLGFGLNGASFSAKTDLQVGDQVTVFGNLKIHSGSSGDVKEFDAGNRLLAFNRPLVPSISADPVAVDAAAHTGQSVTITYENWGAVSVANAEATLWDNEACDEDFSGDWISSVDVAVNFESVSFDIAANTGAARTAYMKIYALGDDATTEAEKVIAISQEAYVAPALPASLPFAFDGGRADIASTQGMSQEGLDSDYGSSPKLKFNTTGDYVIINIASDPGKLTYDIIGNGFSGGTFKVQESADGSDYSDVATYTELSGTTQNEEKTLDQDTRFVKFIYTTKDAGNVALGNIAIAEYVAPAAVETPAFSPAGGEYAGAQSVELSCTTEGAAIYYTTNGDDPDNTKTQYEGAINVDATMTIKAIAYKGDDHSEIASATYTITAPLTDYYEKVTSGDVAEGTYLIVYEAGNVAFNGGLETLDASSNTIAVTITNDHKIGVTSATAAATFYIDPTAGTIKSASGRYIGRTANSNGLNASETEAYTNTISIDGDGNAVIVGSGSTATYLRYNPNQGQTRFRYFTQNQQMIALYKLANEVIKPASGLAWDPAGDIELTVGDAFSAPTLLNPNNIPAGDITIASSNELVATVSAGVVSLVENATGTTTITATYTGETYKPITVSYKIKVNPASSIVVSPSLYVNFASVEKDASLPTDKTITVTLNNVATATATLGGTNPVAFSIDKTALVEGENVITISVASTATAGEFSATITIADDATENPAAQKVVNLSFTVNDPVTPEDPEVRKTWDLSVDETATASTTELTWTATYVSMSFAKGTSTTNTNNYYPGTSGQSYTSTRAYKNSVITITPNGKEITSVVFTATSASYANALQGSGWTNASASVDGTTVTVTPTDGKNAIIAVVGGTCGFTAVQVNYKNIAPEPEYEIVRSGLEINRYYTVCLPKKVTAIKGATFWTLQHKSADGATAYLEEETNNLPFAAGTPFIIQATAANLEVVYEGDATEVAGTNGALHGTLVYMSAATLDAVGGSDVYMLYENALRPVGENNHLDANRAYVLLSELDAVAEAPQSAPGKRVRAMPMQPQTATGIEDINASEKPMKMMINGQIFILRGEKMYDTTGRLVK